MTKSKFSLWPRQKGGNTSGNAPKIDNRRKHVERNGQQRGYAVCTLPRSGSNFFCDILTTTGVLGNPREFFNTEARRMYDDPTYPEDRFAQIERILTMGATDNGVYAMKIFPGLHDLIAPTLRWTVELPNLSFVRFRREDVLGQAISWVRSGQTRQFRSSEPVVGETHYDGPAIAGYVRKICQRNARWEMYFTRTGIQPLDVSYEGFMADPTGTVQKIASLMNVEFNDTIDLSKSRFKKQRTDENAVWRERFISEYGDRDDIDPFWEPADQARG
ncbi:MAG: Stf0 family sulfotransferase [Hyphomicrobium sp.]|uniref:Stf0 family sulfotransferase n=1 Tax=Hyphomicrobium sp. TaxID=82 RepID=UPI0039E34A5F